MKFQNDQSNNNEGDSKIRNFNRRTDGHLDPFQKVVSKRLPKNADSRLSKCLWYPRRWWNSWPCRGQGRADRATWTSRARWAPTGDVFGPDSAAGRRRCKARINGSNTPSSFRKLVENNTFTVTLKSLKVVWFTAVVLFTAKQLKFGLNLFWLLPKCHRWIDQVRKP